MKKGQTNRQTLILLQQDIREFYKVAPHEMKQKGQLNENVSKARAAFCCIAFGISQNLFNVDAIAKSLNRSNQLVYQWIRQGQSLSDLGKVKAHLKAQCWNNI